MIRDMIEFNRDTYNIRLLEMIRPYLDRLREYSYEVEVKPIDRYRSQGYFDRLLQKAIGVPSILWDITKMLNGIESNSEIPEKILLIDINRSGVYDIIRKIEEKIESEKEVVIDG